MKKSNRGGTESARVCWAGLEGWVRERVQGYVQDLLQEEVTELLGRGKSQRRPAVDALPGSRNGLGKPRKLTLGCGTAMTRRRLYSITTWERMVTFYRYPKEHWTHLRTTNVVESPFASVRLRTEAAKRYKKVDNATAVIWKVLLVAEKRFRKLNAPHLMKDVYQSVRFVDGVRESKRKNRKDAA